MALHLVIGASTTLHAEMVARVERVSEDQRRPNFRRGLKGGGSPVGQAEAAHLVRREERGPLVRRRPIHLVLSRWIEGAVGEAGEGRGERGRGEKPIVGGKERKNWVGMGWWASKAN